MTEHPLRYRGIDIPGILDPRNGLGGENARALCNFLAGVDAVRDQEEELGAGHDAPADDEWCNCQAVRGGSNYPGPWHERGGEEHYPCARRIPAECGPALPEGTWLH